MVSLRAFTAGEYYDHPSPARPRPGSVFLAPCISRGRCRSSSTTRGVWLWGSTNFEGSGQFKFALVNGKGTTTFWSNDGSSVAGSEPTAAVTLTVTKGLYWCCSGMPRCRI